MKQLMQDFKNSKPLKLYCILFSLIHLVYVYFEVSKSLYIQTHSLEGALEKYQFEHLSSLSKITYSLELLIILLCIVFLISVVRKKDNTAAKHFILLHFALLIVLTFISYLVSILLEVSFLSLALILYYPLGITFLFLLYLVAKILYKKIFRNSMN
ncbi:hypothetical protein SAMN05192551_11038 [Tindallia magadiensis]|uniref:Uncharacterized protein n=1 Tax=Tindallia magadiensis TaxID=69895 RepID=A0A1I3GTF4_9FIRM|nr:hypothetical protein SAMN05192551_11038 [Tindallia magadiensis]